jgi:hypothetical protein
MLNPARAILGAVMVMLVMAPSHLQAASLSGPTDYGYLSGPSDGTCVVAQVPVRDQKRKPQAHRGVLGWLYKYTRNVDLERAGVSRLPGFLRSPLLGSLRGRTENCDPAPSLEQPTTCAVVALDPGSSGERTVTVPLPQMSVTTTEGLEERIHEQLALGEWVSLRTNRGETIRFDRKKVRFVQTSVCRKDA